MTFYRHSERERFEKPLPGESRAAVLSPHFHEKHGVRCFDQEDIAEIVAFAPDIVAGTVPALLHLAPHLHVSSALVAFSGYRIGEIGRKDRDFLWTAFQVPLFEQCFGPDGAIVARECEAHDGLHVFPNDSRPLFPIETLRWEPCPCGRVEPRI